MADTHNLVVTVKNAEDKEAILSFNGKEYACVIGRSGAVPAQEKIEGDGTTPLGEYRILRGFYRADRLEKPKTSGLEMVEIQPDMGWGDDPKQPNYNHWIEAGYAQGGEESFWRKDECYNIILVVDHNGAWPFEGAAPESHQAEIGKGSAIFIHMLKRDEKGKPVPTAGCVAFEQNDLIEIVSQLEKNHPISIRFQ